MKKLTAWLSLVLLLSNTAVSARGWVSISAPSVPDANFSGTDKAPANVPILVDFNDFPCVGTPGCSTTDVPSCNSGKTVVLHWGTVDANGNWTSANDTVMSCTNNGIPTCGSNQDSWKAQIPAQPNGTKIEFVIHVFGGGEDKWLKDSGKATSGFGNASPCNGDPNQKGWRRVANISGSNFYYTTIETPYVVIDFPQENEIITSPAYTIRVGANSSTNNARVKIDTGDWSQCRFASGYWWFDWANYPTGAHTIIAEGWNDLGQRAETSPRNCTYQP